MKVVKEGSLINDKDEKKKLEVHKCTCKECRSVLEFDYSDVVVNISQNKKASASITCPVCHSWIELPGNASRYATESQIKQAKEDYDKQDYCY